METVSNDPSGKVFRIHMYICINRRVGYMCVSAAIILAVRFSFLSSIFSFLICFFPFFSLFLFKIMRLYILRFRKLLFLHLLQSNFRRKSIDVYNMFLSKHTFDGKTPSLNLCTCSCTLCANFRSLFTWNRIIYSANTSVYSAYEKKK